MRRLGALDSVFLALEGPGHPLHTMAVLVLDPTTIPDGYDFERMREFVASRLPAIPPLRRCLVSVPLGIGRPYWVDTEVDIAQHVENAKPFVEPNDLDRDPIARVPDLRLVAGARALPLCVVGIIRHMGSYRSSPPPKRLSIDSA